MRYGSAETSEAIQIKDGEKFRGAPSTEQFLMLMDDLLPRIQPDLQNQFLVMAHESYLHKQFAPTVAFQEAFTQFTKQYGDIDAELELAITLHNVTHFEASLYAHMGDNVLQDLVADAQRIYDFQKMQLIMEPLEDASIGRHSAFGRMSEAVLRQPRETPSQILIRLGWDKLSSGGYDFVTTAADHAHVWLGDTIKMMSFEDRATFLRAVDTERINGATMWQSVVNAFESMRANQPEIVAKMFDLEMDEFTTMDMLDKDGSNAKLGLKDFIYIADEQEYLYGSDNVDVDEHDEAGIGDDDDERGDE